MKKGIIVTSLCAVMVLFLSAGLSAQDENSPFSKGNWEVNPTSAFDLDFGDVNATTLQLGVGAAYFIIDDLNVGAELGFTWIDDWAWFMNFGPRINYFVVSKVRVGTGLDVMIVEGSDAQLSLPISVGYPIFITDDVAIEPNVNFNLGLTDGVQDWGMNLGFNFDFYFGGK